MAETAVLADHLGNETIITPENVAKPMVVSTALPPETAVMVTPLPRWKTTIFSSDNGRSNTTAARWLTYRTEVP